jgi:hypothetical protein
MLKTRRFTAGEFRWRLILVGRLAMPARYSRPEMPAARGSRNAQTVEVDLLDVKFISPG